MVGAYVLHKPNKTISEQQVGGGCRHTPTVGLVVVECSRSAVVVAAGRQNREERADKSRKIFPGSPAFFSSWDVVWRCAKVEFGVNVCTTYVRHVCCYCWQSNGYLMCSLNSSATALYNAEIIAWYDWNFLYMVTVYGNSIPNNAGILNIAGILRWHIPPCSQPPTHRR